MPKLTPPSPLPPWKSLESNSLDTLLPISQPTTAHVLIPSLP